MKQRCDYGLRCSRVGLFASKNGGEETEITEGMLRCLIEEIGRDFHGGAVAVAVPW